MSKRVGRYRNRITQNSTRDDRKQQIETALLQANGEKMTMPQIARTIGMQPSNHVLTMLKEMQVSDRVDVDKSARKGLSFAYQWHIPCYVQMELQL